METRSKRRGLPALRAAREAAGLTQAQLEARVGLSSGSVQRWENCDRDPSVWNAIALADALGVSIERIAGLPERAPAPVEVAP